MLYDLRGLTGEPTIADLRQFMLWFYERDHVSLRLETRYDNDTAEYVAIYSIRSGRWRPLLGEPALGLGELIERFDSLVAERGIHVDHAKERRLCGDNSHRPPRAVHHRECHDPTEDAPDLLGSGVPGDKTQVDQRAVRPGGIHRLTLKPLDDVSLTNRIPPNDRESLSRAIEDVLNWHQGFRPSVPVDYEASSGPMMMNLVAHIRHLQCIDGALATISTSSDRQSVQVMTEAGTHADSRPTGRSCH